jgi:hypothetical protein
MPRAWKLAALRDALAAWRLRMVTERNHWL